MNNKLFLILTAFVSLAGKMNSQTVNPSPYCAARISANSTYYNNRLQAVNIGTLSNTTGTVYYAGSDYVYYNNLPPVALQKGATIPATFTVSRNDIEINVLWVYIDHNINNSFEANEIVGQASQSQFTVASSYGPSVTININITLPLSAQNGQTRMRIMYTSDAGMFSVTTPTACNSNTSSMQGPTFQYGEIEDYDVIISGQAVQAPVASFSVVSKTCKGQSLTLSDNSANTPTSWSWTLTGGTPSVSSVQNPSVTYNTPGTFTVMLSSGNAGGSSPIISKTLTVNSCTGIDGSDADVTDQAVLYPNPGNGYFHLELNKAAKVFIHDLQGKDLSVQNLPAGHHVVDLSHQARGLYFVTIHQNGRQQHLKLIKE